MVFGLATPSHGTDQTFQCLDSKGMVLPSIVPDSADVVVAYGCEFQLISPQIACFWRLIALNGAILGYR